MRGHGTYRIRNELRALLLEEEWVEAQLAANVSQDDVVIKLARIEQWKINRGSLVSWLPLPEALPDAIPMPSRPWLSSSGWLGLHQTYVDGVSYRTVDSELCLVHLKNVGRKALNQAYESSRDDAHAYKLLELA